MASSDPGEIITFYSYKGGTGRSMMLANVAWILACNGKRVLAVDWDLEAPGLHQYFRPFLVDQDLKSSDGVIDFVTDFSLEAAARSEESTDGDGSWIEDHANILRYAASLRGEFAGGGTLDFVPAGRQGPSYSTRVNSFSWPEFYDVFRGSELLDSARNVMRNAYDYVLVDSRTGVSDTSGICTVQLPDTLVVCFTLNNQSIEGASGVTASILEQRKDSHLRVLPIPMRIETSEKVKLEARTKLAKERFGRFAANTGHPDWDEYYESVQVLSWPYYGFDEVLATFADDPGGSLSILASAERLTSYLTRGEVTRAVRPSDAQKRAVLVDLDIAAAPALGLDSAAGARIYVSYRRGDSSGYAGYLSDALTDHFGPASVFMDVDSLQPGVDFVTVIEEAMRTSDIVLAIIGPAWLDAVASDGRRRIDDPDDFVRLELESALRSDALVLPVLLGGAQLPRAGELPDGLQPLVRRHAIEITDATFQEDVRRLVRIIDLLLARPDTRSEGGEPAAETAPARERRLRWAIFRERYRHSLPQATAVVFGVTLFVLYLALGTVVPTGVWIVIAVAAVVAFQRLRRARGERF